MFTERSDIMTLSVLLCAFFYTISFGNFLLKKGGERYNNPEIIKGGRGFFSIQDGYEE